MKKTLIHLIFALSFLTGMAFLTSCGGDSHDGDHDQTEQHEPGDGDHDHAEGEDHEHGDGEEAVDKTGPEYTSAYVCPMHCEGSGSEEPGKCPVCGMEYVANADDSDGGGQDHNGEGHDHDDSGS